MHIIIKIVINMGKVLLVKAPWQGNLRQGARAVTIVKKILIMIK